MALISSESFHNFLRVEDLSYSEEKFKIIKVENKEQFDKFKRGNIETIHITLSNGKIFVVQNEINRNRILWNFESIEKSVGEELGLYVTEISVNERTIKTIRVRYNILNKIKTKFGEN